MQEISTAQKDSELYLDIATNGNGAEKAMLTLRALARRCHVPRETTHIIEIGPGGGAAVSHIADTLSDTVGDKGVVRLGGMHMSLLELESIESGALCKSREKFSGIGTSSLHTGDAREIEKIFPDGADVVAASAVMHEIYSYGGGYQALDDTFSAITRVLRPGGYLAYRDVFSVDRPSQHERTRHIYDRESWVRFAQLFLPHYLQHAQHPYHREDDKVIFEQDSRIVASEAIDPKKYLSISAPIGLLRELQRHYITLRDFMWRTGVLGIRPIMSGDRSNDWLDMKAGLKRVYFQKEIEDTMLIAMSERIRDGLYAVDGDSFDTTTDVLLGKFLKEVVSDSSALASAAWDEWFKREGSETYTYMTTGRLLGAVATRSLEASERKKILLPALPEDVLGISRKYYSRYLTTRLSNPLPEGKQLVLFQAMCTEKEPDRIGRSLEILGEHCTKETIANIYEPIAEIL